MNTQNLIIHKLNSLYHIFKELDQYLNFNIIESKNETFLNNQIYSLKNYLILTDKIDLEVNNKLTIDNFPIHFFYLIEKINIQFLKQQFSNQSQFIIKNFIIDLNSREMFCKNLKLKLTEKEINTIIHLSKSSCPVSTKELQEVVWRYQANMETHTVETHIYRLRKKIADIFNDNEFIVSEKNGYQIK